MDINKLISDIDEVRDYFKTNKISDGDIYTIAENKLYQVKVKLATVDLEVQDDTVVDRVIEIDNLYADILLNSQVAFDKIWESNEDLSNLIGKEFKNIFNHSIRKIVDIPLTAHCPVGYTWIIRGINGMAEVWKSN